MHEEPFGLAVAEVLFLRRLRGPGVPFVVSSAQNIDKRYPPPFRWFERWSLRRAAGAYPCNAEAGRILRRKGLRGELVVLPARGRRRPVRARRAPTPVRRPARRVRGPADPPQGGRRAARGGGPRRPDAASRSSGPGPSRTAGGAGRRLGIADRVTFHGHVDEEGIPETYRHFDVLAVPSVPMPGWLEQFGRVVVEAQASGIPVVASASGALPDVVGEDGLLVPPGDPRALRAALARLLDEPGLWERLRAAGMAGRRRCSWEQVAETQLGPVPGRLAGLGPGTCRRRPRPVADRPCGRATDGRVGARRPPPSAVELLEPVDVARQGEPSLAVAGGARPRPPSRRVRLAARSTSARAAAAASPGREQQPVVPDGLEVGTAAGGHHRDAVGHGLDHRQPERLGRRGGQ